jgi:hypothetical protein
VVDVHLAQPGAFHHRVERDEVLFDEAHKIQRVVYDGGFGFANVLEGLN